MAGFRTRKRIKPLSFKTAILISLAIFLVISIQTFLFIEKRIEPAMLNIANTKVEQLAAGAINEAIRMKIADGTDFKDLVYFKQDGDGKIKAVLFNYNEQTRIVGEATARVSNTLKELEAVPLVIPLGQALNSNILATIGPDVPITMVPMGSVKVNLIPEVREVGINGVHVNVHMDVEAKVNVVIPFATKPTIVKTQIPLTQGLFMGEVPDYYFKGDTGGDGHSNPSLLPPLQMDDTDLKKEEKK
ncbi:sporulation protein YunB [Ammoniphilus oxalaticus]|uniref:Sporulation protein YunB n=1 Tax=Ammoniphilus oxalaticus TaxID=66863 RepID=A0A419SEI5_9BACL|nr:sporulation protein YunB [Ammoniphilus oxalaticus]RKD21728.1 sporulation protein YunB [Ammoniphilus oxalaticus]